MAGAGWPWDSEDEEAVLLMFDSLKANIQQLREHFPADPLADPEAPEVDSFEDFVDAVQALFDDIETSQKLELSLARSQLLVWFQTIRRALALHKVHEKFLNRRNKRGDTKVAWARFLKQHKLDAHQGILAYDQSLRYVALANLILEYPALRFQTHVIGISDWKSKDGDLSRHCCYVQCFLKITKAITLGTRIIVVGRFQ